jgi:hypothetical protein
MSIHKIRLLLEYNAYCIWLYDENDEIIANDNPPEWEKDQELTDAFMAVSDIYDSFFIDNEKVFEYIGCKDAKTFKTLESAIEKAMQILMKLNNNKYIIINDIKLPNC